LVPVEYVYGMVSIIMSIVERTAIPSAVPNAALTDLNATCEMARVLKNNDVILVIDAVLRFIPLKLLVIARSVGSRIRIELGTPYTLKSCGTRITNEC